MQINCPICKEKASNYNVPVEKYAIYKCPKCGLEYTYPIPTDSQLEEFYSSYFDIRADSTIVNLNATNNLKALSNYGIDNKSIILDFGCGNGEFVNIAGQNCYGIELGKSNHCRIFNSFDYLPIKQYDCITLWGVLEHLNNISEIMKNVSNHLKSNGIIVITTVDAEGNIPYYYKPPEHLTYWTKESLNILASTLNCQIEEFKPYYMNQLSEVYLNRLFSRTPTKYANIISANEHDLPNIIKVPTNEFFAVLRKNKI